MEKTLVIVKPDGINRGIAGEIIHRFERKGLKIVAIKMLHLGDDLLDLHYEQHKDKPFFERLKSYMKKTPTILMVLEGKGIVEVIRTIAGPTKGYEANPGTIRGDYSMSIQNTVIHASESVEAAEKEIKIFFKDDEIFNYTRIDMEMIYAEEER
ncbi:nucleoside-diphosphate kinase [Candidatus Berkelbacteria bacterium RIFCSPHIGHO2_12_FULL_36_9]|uniref:Nucleoside diphosphate kinase n=1 Tax=Candidatus Berkelbacteria bacterium RIFCSPHIGHO2_12_FULL_36_9 TaxID=1797469 RepID=A0A1F5EI74_9BACT|nr:MAG: nucleoside-diphosphate kinase [Candidatus Berkelbacteria bacterium RIFCSPHIGHO2_12_FULL_36_9]